MNGLVPFIIIFCTLPLIVVLTTTVHEAGHALVACIYTNDKVIVFLGSYGEEKGSRCLSFGRFVVWFRLNILRWRGGLCTYSAADVSFRQAFAIILAGPLASLLQFSFLLTILLAAHPSGLWAPFLCIFCIWAGLVFLYNIVPRAGRIDTGGSDMLRSDGTKLQMMLEARKMPDDYAHAVQLLNEGNFAEAAAIFDKIIGHGTKSAQVYRQAVDAYIKLKNYRRADQIQREKVAKIGNLDAHDRIHMALLKVYMGKYDEAISYYRHLLQMGGGNKYNLNNFGYTLNRVEEFEDAIPYLDQAISMDKEFAGAYSNRAYAKLMAGQIEEGKTDNDLSLRLDNSNSEVYRNDGIYLFKTGDYSGALEQLNKAKAMDPDTWMVDHFIQRTMNWVGKV